MGSGLRIRRVYDPPEQADGARVLVDRLWPRGLRKEDSELALWLKDAAPGAELREWLGHDPARWTEFRQRYRVELAHKQAALQPLADLMKRGTVTLLYAARDEAHDNAVVLADYLEKQS